MMLRTAVFFALFAICFAGYVRDTQQRYVARDYRPPHGDNVMRQVPPQGDQYRNYRPPHGDNVMRQVPPQGDQYRRADAYRNRMSDFQNRARSSLTFDNYNNYPRQMNYPQDSYRQDFRYPAFQEYHKNPNTQHDLIADKNAFRSGRIYQLYGDDVVQEKPVKKDEQVPVKEDEPVKKAVKKDEPEKKPEPVKKDEPAKKAIEKDEPKKKPEPVEKDEAAKKVFKKDEPEKKAEPVKKDEPAKKAVKKDEAEKKPEPVKKEVKDHDEKVKIIDASEGSNYDNLLSDTKEDTTPQIEDAKEETKQKKTVEIKELDSLDKLDLTEKETEPARKEDQLVTIPEQHLDERRYMSQERRGFQDMRYKQMQQRRPSPMFDEYKQYRDSRYQSRYPQPSWNDQYQYQRKFNIQRAQDNQYQRGFNIQEVQDGANRQRSQNDPRGQQPRQYRDSRTGELRMTF